MRRHQGLCELMWNLRLGLTDAEPRVLVTETRREQDGRGCLDTKLGMPRTKKLGCAVARRVLVHQNAGGRSLPGFM